MKIYIVFLLYFLLEIMVSELSETQTRLWFNIESYIVFHIVFSQSYGIQHSETQSVDNLTYVDYVEVNGPAYLAGMMAGGSVLYCCNGVWKISVSTSQINYKWACQKFEMGADWRKDFWIFSISQWLKGCVVTCLMTHCVVSC